MNELGLEKKLVNSEKELMIGLKWDEIEGQVIDLDLQCIILNELG